MNSSGSSFDPPESSDPKLGPFVEQIIARLEGGEPIDIEAIVGPEVEYAPRLRELLPAIEGMLRLPPPPSLNPAEIPLAISPSRAELGDFRLVREIGRGGMGTVFEAEQISMGRRVALKILPFATLADEKSLQRFRNEVRAAAALDHPHIVSVYSVGEQRGIHFYAMRLIHGQTLAESIDELRRLRRGRASEPTPGACADESETGDAADTVIAEQSNPSTLAGTQRPAARFRAIAQLGIDAAEALQHAHDQGVIHRDIKPANLLLDTSGKIHVADFGLARIGADAGLTRTGDVVGTLRYMPPEQVMGRHVTVDHRSDIYSLGVTLYELLTLTPAFDAADRAELLRQVAFQEPRPPRRIDPAIPAELDTIILKAMAKEPGGRYATAQELADDLRRFLNDQPIKARPPTLFDRVRKLSRRHSKALPAIGMGLFLLTGILAAAVVQIYQSRTRALEALETTSDMLYTADVSQAYDMWDKGWWADARDILRRHEGGPPERYGLEWEAISAGVMPPEAMELVGHEGSVNELALFPDGRRIASVGDDGTLRIWDWQTGRQLREIKVDRQPLYSVATSADGRYIATGSTLLTLFDFEMNAQRRLVFASLYNFESIAFHPNGKQLAAGARYHDVLLLSLDETKVDQFFSGSRVSSLEYLPDGRLLVPMLDRRTDPNAKESIDIRDDKLAKVRSYVGHTGLKVAHIAPDGEWILAGGRDSTASIIDTATGEVVAVTPRGRGELHDVAIAPGSRMFALVYANGVAEVYKLRRGRLAGGPRPPILSFRAHKGEVHCARFLNDHTLATCGSDGKIRIFTLGWDRVKSYFAGPTPIDVKLAPDGAMFAFVHRSGCRLCDTESGRPVANFTAKIAGGSTAAWHPDGTRIALCLRDDRKPIALVDRSGMQVGSFDHQGEVQAVAFSPDGKRLASVGNKCLRVHDVDSGDTVAMLRLTTRGWAVQFSPDSQLLALATQTGPAQLLNVDDLSPVADLEQSRNCGCLAMAPGGDLLAGGHGDGVIRLWEFPSGELRYELTGHERGVTDLVFARRGKTLVSAANDGTVRLWSVEYRREYGPLVRSRSPIEHTPEATTCRVSVSPDNRYLVVSDGHQATHPNVHVWHLGEESTFIPLE